MIRRPPRSTLDRSSAASDVYKRQHLYRRPARRQPAGDGQKATEGRAMSVWQEKLPHSDSWLVGVSGRLDQSPVSYTHLRAHETVLDLVCRLLLEKKKNQLTEATAHSIAAT